MAWPPKPRVLDTSAHRSGKTSTKIAIERQRRAMTFLDDDQRTEIVIAALELLDENGLASVYSVLKQHHTAPKKDRAA